MKYKTSNKKELKEFEDKVNYYLSRVEGMPLIGPDIIQIAITHRCNLRCKFCDVCKDDSEEMSTNEIKRIILEFHEMGGKKVFLVGGEPFLRPDFFDIMQYANELGMISIVSTNGTLITDEIVKKIIELPIHVVMFSIDGPDAKTHDRLRGIKVFDKSIAAYNRIKKKKDDLGLGKYDSPMLGTLSIVLNSNLELIPDIINLSIKLDSPFINFQPIQTNNTIMVEKDLLNPEWVSGERLFVLDKIMDQVRDLKDNRIKCDTKGIKDYFRLKVYEPRYKCYQNYLRVVVKPDGRLWTCRRYHNSLKDYSLNELWNSKKMKEDRKLAKECNSMCMQRCIYFPNCDSLKSICKPYINSRNSVDCLNILKNVKTEDKHTNEELINEIKKFEDELYRKNCKYNCNFCRLLSVDICKGSKVNNEIMYSDIPKIIITNNNYMKLKQIVQDLFNKGYDMQQLVYLDCVEGYEDIFNQQIPDVINAAKHINDAKSWGEKNGIKFLSNPAPMTYKLNQDLLEGFDTIKPSYVISGKKPKISVIIPTMNRLQFLRNTLKHLFMQDFKDFEIILVDDNSSEDILSMIKKMDFPVGMKYIFWPRKDDFVAGEYMNRAGPVRNLGVKWADGDYFVFIDNDMIVQSNFIRKHYMALQKNDVVIGTRVDLDEGQDLSCLNRVEIKDFKREPLWQIHKNKFIGNLVPYKFCFSCNLSISRKAFSKFDKEYVCWGIEDEVFGYNLYNRGKSFLFERNIVAYHQYHDLESINIFIKRKGRVYNQTRFYKKYLDWNIYKYYFDFYKQTCKFEFQILDKCNNNCLYCKQITKTKYPVRIKDLPAMLKQIIEYGLDKYFDTVIGCEITIYPEFWEIIKIIKNMKNVKIQTNGRMFSYEDFLKKIPDKIKFETLLFGLNHDKITKVKGSKKQAIIINNSLLVISSDNFTPKMLVDNPDAKIMLILSDDFKESLNFVKKIYSFIKHRDVQGINCINRIHKRKSNKYLMSQKHYLLDCYYCKFIKECKGKIEKYISI